MDQLQLWAKTRLQCENEDNEVLQAGGGQDVWERGGEGTGTSLSQIQLG